MELNKKPVCYGNCHSSIKLVLFIILMLLGAKEAMAQKKDPCSQVGYKILTPAAIGLNCINDVSILGILGGSGTVISHESANYGQQVADIKISFFKTESAWLLLILSGSPGALEAGKKYTLSLTYTLQGTPTTTVGPVSVDIDTTESVTVSATIPQDRRIQPNDKPAFLLKSSVGFSTSEKKLAYATRQETKSGQLERVLEERNYFALDGVNRRISMKAKCTKFTSLQSASPPESDLQAVDPIEVGIYFIQLDEPFTSSLIPGPPPFTTIFGTSPKIDPKSRFSPAKAPDTKDASQYYVNFNWAAGVGTVPAWVLDGNIAPKLWMLGGYALAPLASADVGNNKLTGQTYTDTIDFGFTGQKPYFFDKYSKSGLGELLFTPGVKYETDREFNHDNLLATADLKYYFRGLYRTQSVITLQRFYEALQQYRDRKNAGGPGSDTPYQPQVDDFRPPLLGYSLDFHTGIETGGALVDTTVHATTGKATEVLPTYSIFRVVPQVEGLLELWKFSFNANMTGRFLAVTENTVLQTRSNALVLTRVSGWKGIGMLTTTYNLDSLGHFAVNVVFKDGFAPPTYKRVNAVQAGILIKY
jgi:hypothetical protein